jgi:hypothetical protein
MSLNKTRSFLYALARFLGDVNAVRRGKIGQRVGRRVAGKIVGKLFGKFFK